MLNRDRIMALILLGVCGFLFTLSFSYPVEATRWPQVLLLLLGFFSFILLITGRRKLKKKTESAIVLPKLRIILLVGASIVYIVCINIIGFLVSTLGFSLSMPYLLGIKNKWVILGTGVLMVAFIYTLFWKILKIPLPKGALF